MRLIDADALGVTDFELVLCDGDYKELCKTLIAKVESASTIDAIPVVRCRECEMANPCSDEREMYCTLHLCYKRKNYYCADGRREDGEA